MIRAGALGVARVLFGFAVVAFVVAALLTYGAWRAARVAVAGRPSLAQREAAFGVLLALVQFARAHKAAQPELVAVREEPTE